MTITSRNPSKKGLNSSKNKKYSRKPELKVEEKKPKGKKQQEENLVEHFEGDFVSVPEKLMISQEDENILNQFFSQEAAFKLAEGISGKFEQKRQAEIQENILNDPKVKLVYSDVAKLMKEYTSGKLARAFKVIPLLQQWEKVLALTKPLEWSPQAMASGTALLSSSLDVPRARYFYETYLLEKVKSDVAEHKKLNVHFYFSLKKAFYKPAAWFKGILFPLAQSEDCTIKMAQIVASVLAKISVPAIHASVALLKLAQMPCTGPSLIFMKVLIEKQYALPVRVITGLLQFFGKFEADSRTMPVIWHQLLLRFVELYKDSLDEMQKAGIKQLIERKNHHLISQEVVKALENKVQVQPKAGNLASGMDFEN